MYHQVCTTKYVPTRTTTFNHRNCSGAIHAGALLVHIMREAYADRASYYIGWRYINGSENYNVWFIFLRRHAYRTRLHSRTIPPSRFVVACVFPLGSTHTQIQETAPSFR